MQIGTAQKLQGHTTIPQQVTVRPYQQIIVTKQQTDQNAVSTNATVGDRVQLSANARHTANLIFEKIANRVTERYDVNAAAQIQFDPNLDTSSEATANCLLTFATRFYQSYREQHVGEDEEKILKRFTSIMRDAVDQGFNGARGTLSGLSAFTPQIKEMIDETYLAIARYAQGF